MKRILFLIFCFLSVQGTAQTYIMGNYNPEQQTFEAEDSTVWVDWFTNEIAKFSIKGYLGLIDTNGQILCEAKYDKIFDFEGEVARVILNGKYGLINTRGEELVEPCLDLVHEFRYGVAICARNNKYGLLKENGRFLTAPAFRLILPYANNGHLYQQDRTIGLIDSKGKRKNVYNLQMDSVVTFKSDKPVLKHLDFQASLFAFHEGLTPTFEKKDGRWLFGFMDINLKTVIKPVFDWVEPFIGGYAAVLYNGKWGAIDLSGNIVVEPKYHSIKNGARDKFIVSTDGEKHSLIDNKQNTILKEEYLSLHHLFKDLYATHGKPSKLALFSNPISHKMEQAWGVIDETGEFILPQKYLGVGTVNDSLGMVSSFVSSVSLNTGLPRYNLFATYTPFCRDSLLGSKTTSYSKLIEMQSDWFDGHIEPHDPSYYLPYNYLSFNLLELETPAPQLKIEKELRAGFSIVSKTDTVKTIASPIWFGAHSFGEKTIHNNPCGIIDREGVLSVPIIYDEIHDVGLNLFVAKKNESFGVVNFNNEIVIPIRYEHVEINESAILVWNKIAEYEYEYAIFDLTGDMLIPFTKLPFGIPFRLYQGSIIKKEYRKGSYFVDKAGHKVE